MTAQFLYGQLSEAPSLLIALGSLATAAAMGYRGARAWCWPTALFAVLWLLGAPPWLWLVLGIPTLVLTVPLVRRPLLSGRILRAMRTMGLLPRISETERTAIEAGTVWLDAELFSGRPDIYKLRHAEYPDLSEKERAFLDGPVADVCNMVDDWQVFQGRDLPESVWQRLKDQRFFGLIIPEEYDGLGLSPSANSAVVARLASRSLPLAITVMVPNSLGPAELLIHYGTKEQKAHWLPLLARGEEIPCFALTEPGAGSDAGSLQAEGVVFKAPDGELRLRLNWNKRYITLASIATVLGLAFKLRDPDGLLGGDAELGITCALVPASTPGVELSERHDPLGVPFVNCPTSGENVEVGIDAIIGGVKGAGGGWRMLMECLAAGRGISLPATATGGAQLVARAVGAYAAVRQQFGLPIGRFEGIEEPLARIAGANYVMEAGRRFTCGALDSGAKPAVVTAMAKYQFTEMYRRVINDGMDIVGGSGISRGPRNVLAHGYIGCPISITVEGANILTRTLIIFGQGAIRCHPYAYAEIDALGRKDVKAFDRAFWGHLGHVARNTCRSLLLSVTRGWAAGVPAPGATGRWWCRLSWASASFALFADVAMGTLGGDLKRKEKLTGRFADVFIWMYLAAATLRRFEAEGARKEDLPLFLWSMEHAFDEMQTAFDGILRNFDVPLVGWFFRGPVALWSRINPIGSGPRDPLGSKVARTLLQPGAVRDRLTPLVHRPAEDDPGLGRLERALELCSAADPVLRKVKEAAREGLIPRGPMAAMVAAAADKSIVSPDEIEALGRAEAARAEAVAVDSFTLQEYLAGSTPQTQPTS